jgi:hypothetical protein
MRAWALQELIPSPHSRIHYTHSLLYTTPSLHSLSPFLSSDRLYCRLHLYILSPTPYCLTCTSLRQFIHHRTPQSRNLETAVSTLKHGLITSLPTLRIARSWTCIDQRQSNHQSTLVLLRLSLSSITVIHPYQDGTKQAGRCCEYFHQF